MYQIIHFLTFFIFMKSSILFPDLTHQIIKCAFNVHNELGGGLPERIYQKALAIEFLSQKLIFKEQMFSKISYHGKTIQRNFSDFIIEDLVIVELKSTFKIIPADYAQTKKYLISLDKQLGLLLHFGIYQLTHKRVLNIY